MVAVDPNKANSQRRGRLRRWWRFFRSSAGREPIRTFLEGISDEDAAAIAVAMNEVRHAGRAHPDVNHLQGDIWQIEIDGLRVIYRLLFAEEGRSGEVLLALEIVNKKWQSTKSRHIALAMRRLSEWRERGRTRNTGAASPKRSSTK
jgi:phage-related protein